MNVCQFENDLSYVNLLYRKIIHSKQLPVDKCKFFAKQFCLKYHKFIVGLVGVKESIWCVKKDHAFFTVSELKNVTTATFTDFRIEMKWDIIIFWKKLRQLIFWVLSQVLATNKFLWWKDWLFLGTEGTGGRRQLEILETGLNKTIIILKEPLANTQGPVRKNWISSFYIRDFN